MLVYGLSSLLSTSYVLYLVLTKFLSQKKIAIILQLHCPTIKSLKRNKVSHHISKLLNSVPAEISQYFSKVHVHSSNSLHTVLCWIYIYVDFNVKSQNHGILEVRRDLWRLISPALLLKSGSARTGCSQPCPVRFWVSPGMVTPQSLWATSSSVCSPSQ